MKTDPRTGRPYLLPTVEKLIPDYALEGVPKVVRAANEEARTARDAAVAMRARRNTAKEDLDRAAGEDRQARKEALASGKPAPTSTADTREAELAAAQADYELLVEAASEKVRHLQNVVAAEADAKWKGTVADKLTTLEGEASQLADRLSSVYAEIENQKSVLSTLHNIDPGGDVEVWFQTRRRNSPSDEPLAELRQIAGSAIVIATEGDSGAERRAQRQQERAERDRSRAERSKAVA